MYSLFTACLPRDIRHLCRQFIDSSWMPPVVALIWDAWNSLPSCYSEMKKLAFRVLTIFWSTIFLFIDYLLRSTYSCKQTFSSTNIIKNQERSQLTNENFGSSLKLKTTNYELNVSKVSKTMHSKCSHWICCKKTRVWIID